MKPLFNCPGEGSFIWIMSITSGYPMGAKLIASFYEEGKLSKIQGQRMLAFCNTSGPLFMIGAVGIGMLGSQEAGSIIALSHYAGSILLGLLFSFYGKKDSEDSPIDPKPKLSSAFNGLLTGSSKKTKSLGAILGSSVKNSMESQLLIGGFIILFSVIINLFLGYSSTDGLGFISVFLRSIFAGILEVTTGCQLLAKSTLTMETKIIVLSFLIGWGGFSIHSQAISFLAKTELSMGIYLVSKLFHGIFSSIIAYVLMNFVYVGSIPAFNGPAKMPIMTWSNTFMASIGLLLSALFSLLALFLFGILIRILKQPNN